MTSTHIKYASLAFLSIQTATHVVVTRYSRTASRDNPYIASTVIALVEIMKLVTCFIVHFCEKGKS